METNINIEEIAAIVGADNIKLDEPMKDHITFKVGGPADYYIRPQSKESLSGLIKYLKNKDIDYYIIGNGSNLLVKDKGYRGIIIELLGLNKIEVDDGLVLAQAGASLKDIAALTLEKELTGYEFASGIPGSLGGAVRMNAGAYGGEHKDVIEDVLVLDENGDEKRLSNEECDFGYRHSIIQDNPYVVVEATLRLRPGNKDEIKEKMDDLKQRRESMQPLEYPSAGSTFRRPEGYYVGPMLTELGYKGKMHGGAQVSDKHAGFVINKDNATASDILDLIDNIKRDVKKEKGISIQEEVIVIGE